jgi:hypothetical protein
MDLRQRSTHVVARPLQRLSKLTWEEEYLMRIHMKRLLVHSVMAVAAVVVSIVVPSRADAAKCSITCQGGTCSTWALFKKVYCYCGPNGYPVCGNNAPSLVSEPVETYASSDTRLFASDEQLLHLEQIVEQAFSQGLYDLGDVAARLYDVLVDGDAKVYPEALGDYEAALSSLSDKEWERLETGAR